MTSANRAVLVASLCAALVGLVAGFWHSRSRLSIAVDPQNMIVAEFVTSSDGPEVRRQGLILYGMRLENTGWWSVELRSASLRHEHAGRAHESPAVPTRTTLLSSSATPSLVVESGAERLVLSGWNDLAMALRAAEGLTIPGGTTLELGAVFPVDECEQCNEGLEPEHVALRVAPSSGCVTTLPLEIPASVRRFPAVSRPATDQ
jgi:hypothetical protein